MPKDIAPELLEAVQSSFRKSVEKNARIRSLQQLLEKGKATYEEADEYAAEVGQALAAAFREHVSSSVLPDGRMYYNIASRMLPPELREIYGAISRYAGGVQSALNRKAGIGMKAQRAKYNEDREKGLIEYVVTAPQYDNVRKSFEEDLVNFGQAVVTDTLRSNAEFQYQAGMSPVIRRRTNGGCCDWCAKLAGTYKYEDVRATGSDVYRRHRSCRCTVTYDPGDGRVQNVHTKRWTENRADRVERSQKESSEKQANRENGRKRRMELASGEKVDIIKTEKGLEQQSSNSIRKSIKKIEKSKREHEDKLKNPQNYVQDWDKKSDQYKKGIVEYWKKEIAEKDRAIRRRKSKLKERGEWV